MNPNIYYFLIFLVATIIVLVLIRKSKSASTTTNLKDSAEIFISEITQIDQAYISYTLSKAGDNSTGQILWKNIHDVVLDESKTMLTLITVEDKSLEITDDVDNWYWLLKNVPKHFPSFNYQYVSTFFTGLEACEICGNIAVSKNICEACYETPWEKSKEFPSKISYIKAKQLEIFSTVHSAEEIVFEVLESLAFETNPDWHPLVNKEEVQAYSQKQHWK